MLVSPPSPVHGRQGVLAERTVCTLQPFSSPFITFTRSSFAQHKDISVRSPQRLIWIGGWRALSEREIAFTVSRSISIFTCLGVETSLLRLEWMCRVIKGSILSVLLFVVTSFPSRASSRWRNSSFFFFLILLLLSFSVARQFSFTN